MTYRELQKRLLELSEEHLDCDVTIGFDVHKNNGEEAEFSIIDDTYLLSELPNYEINTDVLGCDDNPILVVSY